jgi:hypothetical protein
LGAGSGIGGVICCPGFFWVDLFAVQNFFFGMLPWAFKLGNIYNIELELVLDGND